MFKNQRKERPQFVNPYSVYCETVDSVSNSQKRVRGKSSKRCFTLYEEIKTLDRNKKRKMSCNEITAEFNIDKTPPANVIANETR